MFKLEKEYPYFVVRESGQMARPSPAEGQGNEYCFDNQEDALAFAKQQAKAVPGERFYVVKVEGAYYKPPCEAAWEEWS